MASGIGWVLKNLWVRRQTEQMTIIVISSRKYYKWKKTHGAFLYSFIIELLTQVFLFSLCVVNWQKFPHNHPSKYVGILFYFFCSLSIYSNKLFLCGMFCVRVLFLRSLWHLADEEWTCWFVNFFCVWQLFCSERNLCSTLIFLIIAGKLWLNFLWRRWLLVLENLFMSCLLGFNN